MDYLEFLRSKVDIAKDTGFEISPDEVNPIMKPHARDAVVWAIRGGRRALFESFGLHKTTQQLEIARLIIKHNGGKGLIVVPLGVKHEFIHDASVLLGLEEPQYVRTMEEVKACSTDIMLTNYERVRDGDIDPKYFTVCSLDEAAILRSGGNKTYFTFLKKFDGVPFKFVATATPSPNDYIELIHYSQFLEILDVNQVKTRFFKRDSTKADHLTLYPHKEKEFWLWVSSWALFIDKPSDLGHSDEGYDLPALDIRYHVIKTDHSTVDIDKSGQLKLTYENAAISLPDAMKEKRRSINDRIAKMAEIVNDSPDDHFILWHDLEDERRAIKKALPEAVEIYGNQDYDIREKNIIDFSNGKIRLLATKKEISGQGCNFQRFCYRAIFIGIDYKFNNFIQAIHRIYRFLQTKRVIIDIILTENERKILQELLKKWEQYNYLTEQMKEIIKTHGLSNISIVEKLSRSMGIERVKIEGKNYTWINNDCILEMPNFIDNSIDLILTSIPFSNHYEYTPSYNDFGCNEKSSDFFAQMDFLTPQLMRVLKPGRIFACHVKDRVLFGAATGTGMPTIEPFHSDCIGHYMRYGFQYCGMITVVTDVVRENAQTYRLGWSEQCKDGTKMGVGCPEYILLFRKLPTDTSTAYADEPVTKNKEDYPRSQWQIDAHALWRSNGDRPLSKEEILSADFKILQKIYWKYSRETIYSYEEHCEIAQKLDEQGRLPSSYMVVAPGSWDDLTVWDDITRVRTLNTSQSQKNLQMHICPLPFDIVKRLIRRFSNTGEITLDPFAGLSTVPLESVKMGRIGIGIELNSDSFRDGLGYLKATEEGIAMPTLFDFFGEDVLGKVN